MEPSNGIKTWQWVVTVVVIIVLIIIGIMVFGNKNDSDIPTDTAATTTDVANNPLEQNRIIMSDQFPGNVVNISSIQLANGGWVAIHKDNAGSPGDIIGTKYFDKGFNTGNITLTSATVEGGRYYAMLHSDNGDKLFNPAKDLPIKDARGSIIMRTFQVSVNVDPGNK
ncbi:MAG: hypothetical protein M3Q80_00960 [bacterium]|nr:hypothetical protein [bacterium]